MLVVAVHGGPLLPEPRFGGRLGDGDRYQGTRAGSLQILTGQVRGE